MEGSDQLWSKFYQNMISGSNQETRKKFGHQKTRDGVGGSKQAIGERSIGGSERSRSEHCGASDQVASNWGAIDWGASDW